MAALERAVADLEAQAASEAATSSELEASIAREEAALVAKRQERQDVERRLAQQQRFEQREEGVAKLLELQLQVQQQVSAVAGSLSQVSNAESAWMPGALKQREQEVDALSSALKRQQQISHDAHREGREAVRRQQARGGGRLARCRQRRRSARRSPRWRRRGCSQRRAPTSWRRRCGCSRSRGFACASTRRRRPTARVTRASQSA